MSESTEAPASASVKIKSPNGFEYIFTMRDDTVSNLMKKMETMETKWKEDKWEPLSQNVSRFPAKKEPEYVQGEVCPLDGGRLVKPQPGSKAPIKCENNKWNPTTKQSYGCAFVKWQNQAPVIPERQIDEERNDARPGAMYPEEIN